MQDTVFEIDLTDAHRDEPGARCSRTRRLGADTFPAGLRVRLIEHPITDEASATDPLLSAERLPERGHTRRPESVSWRSEGCGIIPRVERFPSMKGRELQRLLEREPLGYRVTRQNGSHRTMLAEGRGRVLLSYHDSATVPPGVVRKILMNDVGLTEEEAWEVLG